MNGVKRDLREVRRGVVERLNELNKYLSVEMKKATERTPEEIFDSLPKREARKLCGKVMMQSTVGKSRTYKKSAASTKKPNTTKKVVFKPSARSYNSNNSYFDEQPLANTVRAMRARDSTRTRKTKTPKAPKRELKPCKEGMVRNPATNRCKKIENMNKTKKVSKSRPKTPRSNVFSQSRPLNRTKVMNEEAEFNLNAPTRKNFKLKPRSPHEIKQHMNGVPDRVRELQRERQERKVPSLFDDSNNNNNEDYTQKQSSDSGAAPKLFNNDNDNNNNNNNNNQGEAAKRKRMKELFGESESFNSEPLTKERINELFKSSSESSNL